MDNSQITTLPNGITVISERVTHVQSFSLGCWFNVGSRDESDETNGIAHFLEHMFFKGSQKYSARKISELIESYGGYLNAFTTKEHTCLYARGLAKHLRRSLRVLADMIQNPLLREIDIERETGVILDELHDINDTPDDLIFDKFEELLFSGNTLSYPVIGQENNIERFSQRELSSFFNGRYGGSNLMIVASGLIDHAKLVEWVQKYFTKQFSTVDVPRRKFSTGKVSEHIIHKDIEQVHCVLGTPAFGQQDDQRVALGLLSSMLGDGSSSRLFQSIREKLGISYQIHSFINSYADISAFGVYFSTSERHTARVLSIIAREFRKLREKGVSQRELQKAKEYIKGGLIIGMESTTNRMIHMANSQLDFNRIISSNELIERVDAVTVEDINLIAKGLLHEEEWSKVFITSQDKAIGKAA